jgi:integrase
MANLYRKPVVKIDPKTGEKIKTSAKKRWGQYKDASGQLRRKPLAIDKKAAQAMLNELVRKAEREKAGLIDPTDQQRQRPLKEHLAEFRTFMDNKGVTKKQAKTVASQIEAIRGPCKWKFVGDITATSAIDFLASLRREGRSAQTYNHYLKSLKTFTRWLVRERRTLVDPITHISRLNVATDRRHDRRALSPDEFSRLLDAARTGKRVEGIRGPDRAMMYVLAAWTGFRKGEIGSLTIQSLDLEGDPPTATVEASFSKRRRRDTQVLHPELAGQLKAWLAAKKRRLRPTEPLFPVCGRVPGGTERKTHKMIQRDLEAARNKWFEEAKTPAERRTREQTDFLAYCSNAGLYADFHSCRHLFITSLERAGIGPKMAQTLARHSDIRLTMQVYTHIELHDQTAAIGALPGPPVAERQRPGKRRGRLGVAG